MQASLVERKLYWEAGWDLKAGRVRRHLVADKTSLAGELGLPPSTFIRKCRQLHLCCAKSRSGKCGYCYQHDSHDAKICSKAMERITTEAQAFIGGRRPGLFTYLFTKQTYMVYNSFAKYIFVLQKHMYCFYYDIFITFNNNCVCKQSYFYMKYIHLLFIYYY